MDHIAHPPRVEQFLNYLEFERHFSSYTSRCYGADLRQFCQFLLGIPAEIMPDDVVIPSTNGNGHTNGNGNGYANGNGHAAAAVVIEQLPKVDTSPAHSEELLLNASAEDVRNYLQFMRENNYSKATMARKLATLRSFFKFCNRRSTTPTIR